MDKYAIRRAIVRALFDFENPQEFSVVLGHHAVILAAQKLASGTSGTTSSKRAI